MNAFGLPSLTPAALADLRIEHRRLRPILIDAECAVQLYRPHVASSIERLVSATLRLCDALESHFRREDLLIDSALLKRSGTTRQWLETHRARRRSLVERARLQLAQEDLLALQSTVSELVDATFLDIRAEEQALDERDLNLAALGHRRET